MDGLQRCVRYAFGPNRLHLCGPEANKEVLSYITEQDPDKGLVLLLKQFKNMYPYLKKIAEANGKKDPFDDKVVEAYWLGNDLLENISKKQFYGYLVEGKRIKKMISPGEFDNLKNKLHAGARMHHTFHVYNVWKHKKDFDDVHSHDDVEHCRVSWGKVTAIDGPEIRIRTKSLIYDNGGMFAFGPEFEKTVHRKLQDDFMANVAIDDIVSIHWDQPCEILTHAQVTNLEKYTKLSVELWNKLN